MKEALKQYRLETLPKFLEAARQETPRNDKKVSYLRKEVFNLKKMYGNAEHTTN